MKTSHFLNWFESTRTLLKASMVLIIAGTVFLIVSTAISFSQLLLVQNIQLILITCSLSCITLAIITFALSLPFIFKEIRDRRANDKISNTLKSIRNTLLFRKYLKQKEDGLTIFDKPIPRDPNNKVRREFNQWAKLSLIDIREESVLAIIYMPVSQETQLYFSKMLEQIRDYISDSHPEYFFSKTTKKKADCYFIQGHKRH